MTAIPELTEPLGVGPVSLRFTTERDIPEILIAHQDDRHLHEQLGQRRPPSGADLGSACERAAAERAAGTAAQLTILESGGDTCVGQVLVGGIDWDARRVEVCLWVAPGSRGRGYGSAALGLAARWLLNQCAMARVAVLAVPDNVALRRSAARAGFTEEGVLRSHIAVGGGRADMVSMSLLPEDTR